MQQVLSGYGALASLGEMIGKLEAETVLLVTGKASFDRCGAAQTLMPLLEGKTVQRFSDFAVNPKMEDAVRGAALARDMQPDLIVAVGGGSVLDMAKLIKALIATQGDPAEIMRGKVPVVDPSVPLIAVPTTAGSGSEATHFAVVYIGYDKFSLADSSLLPTQTLLDGALIKSGTAYQKTCNGLDALAQAIESSWACGATAESRETALKAVVACKDTLPKVVSGEASDADLQAMIEAANMAGQGINTSKTTSAHAWSYGITSHYGIPHGHAVWMTLPRIFQLHACASDDAVWHPDGPQGLAAIMEELMQILSIPSADRSADMLTEFLSGFDVQTNLDGIGADTLDKREFLSKQVNVERLSNNPVRLSEADIDSIFEL